MTGPTFSPDGKWMWNGSEWIPAPPQSDVVPTENLDKAEIESVANETGVESETLANVAPYFDENRDGELQRNEIQQAAMSLATQPTISAPTNNVDEGIMPQHQMVQPTPMQIMQPMMQQSVMPQPAAPLPPQPMMQQSVMPQPAAPLPPQPMMQQPMLQKSAFNQHGAQFATQPQKNKKILLVSAVVALILIASGVLYVWSENLAGDQVDPIENGWLFCNNNCDEALGDQVSTVNFGADGSFSGWTLEEQNTFATMSWSTSGNEITIGYKFAEGWLYKEGKYEIIDEFMFVSIYKEIYPESINSGSIVVKENPDVLILLSKDSVPNPHPNAFNYYLNQNEDRLESIVPDWWISDLDLADDATSEDFSMYDFYLSDAASDLTSDSDEPIVYVAMDSGDDLSWATVVVQLSVDNGPYSECTNPDQATGTGCALSDNGDGKWGFGEEITISEGSADLCSDSCDVTVKILDRASNKLIYESSVTSVI